MTDDIMYLANAGWWVLFVVLVAWVQSSTRRKND